MTFYLKEYQNRQKSKLKTPKKSPCLLGQITIFPKLHKYAKSTKNCLSFFVNIWSVILGLPRVIHSIMNDSHIVSLVKRCDKSHFYVIESPYKKSFKYNNIPIPIITFWGRIFEISMKDF